NTLRILQCEIALRPAQVATFVKPALAFVSALLFVPTGEVTVSVVLRIAIFVAQDAGRIRVMSDVLAEEQIVLDQVSNKSAEKDDVRTDADRHPDVGQRAGARKSRIDMDNGRAALLRFHPSAATDRMR